MNLATTPKDYIEVNEMIERDLSEQVHSTPDYNRPLIVSKNKRFSFHFALIDNRFRIVISDNYRNHLSRTLWESDPLSSPIIRRHIKRWLEVGITSAGVLRVRAYVIYEEGDTPIIDELTFGTGGHRLYIQDDGNLVLYNHDKTGVLWKSDTWERAKNIPFRIFTNRNGNGHCYDGTMLPNGLEAEFDDRKLIPSISSIKLERYSGSIYEWVLVIRGSSRSRSERTRLTFMDDTNSSGGTYMKSIKDLDTYNLRFNSKRPDIKKISFQFYKR